VTIRVLLVDDQVLIRSGFAALIDTTEDIEVVGEAADGTEAVARALSTRPDVIVMDIRMPGCDGISATETILRHPDLRESRVLVLTTFESDDHLLSALRAGASGFLGKGVDPEELLDAIRVVAAGESVLSRAATGGLIRHVLSHPVPNPSVTADGELSGLTEREREVVMLVGLGLTNDEVASRLFVSPWTAKTHVNRAMSKLGVRNRSQLVSLAYRTGLVGYRNGTAP
jgi:DNA-binding NarL/FixJ family response regulator